MAAEGVGASMGATAAASGSVADARGATEGSTAALDGPMLAVPSAPHPPSSLRKKRPPGATDLRCAPAAAATSGSECKGSSSSPALSGLQSAHLQTLLDSPRALSSFAAQLSPRLAEMELIRQSRLSVAKVTEGEWAIVLELAARPAG